MVVIGDRDRLRTLSPALIGAGSSVDVLQVIYRRATRHDLRAPPGWPASKACCAAVIWSAAIHHITQGTLQCPHPGAVFKLLDALQQAGDISLRRS